MRNKSEEADRQTDKTSRHTQRQSHADDFETNDPISSRRVYVDAKRNDPLSSHEAKRESFQGIRKGDIINKKSPFTSSLIPNVVPFESFQATPPLGDHHPTNFALHEMENEESHLFRHALQKNAVR